MGPITISSDPTTALFFEPVESRPLALWLSQLRNLLSHANDLRVLAWAFAAFASVRVFSYLPTLVMIGAAGDSSQHSLLTWLAWLGSNVTMAATLWEQSGHRWTKTIAVTVTNAVMCAVTIGVIVLHRI